MMNNPFKFGSVVEGEYFTDRKEEQKFLAHIISSPNHAVLISPRRFGKSSLVSETLKNESRETIHINMQSVTSPVSLAETIYRKYLALHPISKATHYLKGLRIIPTLSINPLYNTPEVSFSPKADRQVILEDVFGMLENAGKKKRLIVVFDEFQDILRIGNDLDRILRSIMQEQKNINYILMGSQEDMMKNIFLRKKSPFYHFGTLIHLDRIPYNEFHSYIADRFERVVSRHEAETVADNILKFTGCHPYYTQQLAFQTWYEYNERQTGNCVEKAVRQIIQIHDFDYSRLWETMNTTNRVILQRLAKGTIQPMEQSDLPTSTVYSALKRLTSSGILIKDKGYNIDDPFFQLWINEQL